jgi:hypothetical protein
VRDIEVNRKLTENKTKAIRHSGTVLSRNVTHAYRTSELNISVTANVSHEDNFLVYSGDIYPQTVVAISDVVAM